MDCMTAALIFLVLSSATLHAATPEPVEDLRSSGGKVLIIGSDHLIRTDIGYYAWRLINV